MAPGRLLQPGWWDAWQTRQQLLWWPRSAAELLTERQLGYLEAALQHLIRFVVEGADNAYFLSRAAPDLRTAIADYLASRSRRVTPPRPAPAVTWSKPVFRKRLREDLGIGRDALATRLILGPNPSAGKIRYTTPSKTSRKIQVAIEDLPAEMQPKYRSAG